MPATREVIGLLLCYCVMIGFLCCRLRERILCHIARSKQTYFLRRIIVSQRSEQCQQFTCPIARMQALIIAICELSIARSNNDDERVFHVVLR